MSDQPNTLTIGDDQVTIPALNGFKAVRAGRLVADAYKTAMPDVEAALAKMRERLATTDALVVTREMAKMPRFHRETPDGDVPMFSEGDFAAQPDGVIRLPRDPTRQDVIRAVFPVAFEQVESSLVELLALVICPNDELLTADENGTVDDLLSRKGRELLHKATVPQLLALTTAAVQQVADAISGDSLGEALGAVTGQVAPITQTPPDSPAEAPTTEATPPPTPESPIDSPPPTGGPEPIASTEPPGPRSST